MTAQAGEPPTTTTDSLSSAARDALNCRAGCTHACRVCLQDYDNQRVWEKLDRQPVLHWLKQLLAEQQEANPYARFNAAPHDVRDGTPLLLAELKRTTHLIAIAPILFCPQPGSETRDSFLAPETLAFVRKLCAWMLGGGRLEVALGQPPVFSPESSASLALWHELQPRLADGSLKFWKLPRAFDARSWPRAMTNPGRTGSVRGSRQPESQPHFSPSRCPSRCGRHPDSQRTHPGFPGRLPRTESLSASHACQPDASRISRRGTPRLGE